MRTFKFPTRILFSAALASYGCAAPEPVVHAIEAPPLAGARNICLAMDVYSVPGDRSTYGYPHPEFANIPWKSADDPEDIQERLTRHIEQIADDAGTPIAGLGTAPADTSIPTLVASFPSHLDVTSIVRPNDACDSTVFMNFEAIKFCAPYELVDGRFQLMDIERVEDSLTYGGGALMMTGTMSERELTIRTHVRIAAALNAIPVPYTAAGVFTVISAVGDLENIARGTEAADWYTPDDERFLFHEGPRTEVVEAHVENDLVVDAAGAPITLYGAAFDHCVHVMLNGVSGFAHDGEIIAFDRHLRPYNEAEFEPILSDGRTVTASQRDAEGPFDAAIANFTPVIAQYVEAAAGRPAPSFQCHARTSFTCDLPASDD